MTLGLTINTNISEFTMRGVGRLNTVMNLRLPLSETLDGVGDLKPTLILRLPLNSRIEGKGDLKTNLSMRVPVGEIDLSGQGDMDLTGMMFYQQLPVTMQGKGDMVCGVVLQRDIGPIYMDGVGDMAIPDQFTLRMELATIRMSGEGDLSRIRLSALNTEVFELDGINLLPGQTLVIDTDELNVEVNGEMDVSSVTSDSIFFQLQPGENDITFESSSGSPLNLTVNVVWNNRWL